ncbi:MAG TPA: efflux RND transporter periplasmic adaptor subunit [Blastocatellia bacterium]|nr:efflux RND transporter periplasmic adaptor subunit [Blastocatellia bacterium]
MSDIDQQPAEQPISPAPGEPPPPAKKRPVFRWFAVLLILGLVVAGYAYRAHWQKLFAKESAQTAATIERKVLYWVDPMHPAYKSNQPGKAPDCGMDLVPVYEDGTSMTSEIPPGAIQISPERQQLIGVQTGAATYKSVFKTLRTVGRLAYDETKITRIHPRVEGWIEQVFVDFTGKQVNQGQPLISIYSPELWQTQQEYLLALKGRNELASSQFRAAVAGSESLLQAARKRLELWDIELSQLEHLEHTGKPFKTLTLNAPTAGFVLTRNAFPKQRVTPETELYAIADLSTIWVLADIYEYEAPEIKVGQTANITLSYFPQRIFRGKITNINPQLDPTTRTVKARIEIANPNFALKPEMFANVELRIDYGKHVVVPEEAVMDTGTEQSVFIAQENGYFTPRKVTLGAKVNHEYIVLDGLQAGERVVTSANFLIDSESKLKAAANGTGGHAHGTNAPPTATPTEDHSQHGTPQPSPTRPLAPTNHQHNGNGDLPPEAGNGAATNNVVPSADKLYTCTMHPEIQADKPGDCPKCGMKLVPKNASRK